MKHWTTMSTIAATTCTFALLGACGGGDGAVAPVTITVTGPNAVSQWNEIATTTPKSESPVQIGHHEHGFRRDVISVRRDHDFRELSCQCGPLK